MNTEKELIMALRNGSHEAFKRLYERYQTRIYYFIYGILHSQHDTEELFQSVFLKIWEHRESLDPEQSFSGYIYQVARNSIYNHMESKLYSRKLEEKLSKVLPVSETANSENELIADDLNAYINRLIERLPERRKEIFILHYRQHKTYREITQLLNITENTVDTQIRRALNFLRGEIAKEFTMGTLIGMSSISLLL